MRRRDEKEEANQKLEALAKELAAVPINFRGKKPHHLITGLTTAKISGLAIKLETATLNNARGWTQDLLRDLRYLIDQGMGEMAIRYTAVYDEDNINIENSQDFH